MKKFHEYWAVAGCKPALTCEVCPADPVCRDNSLEAQVKMVQASRQPSIVKSVRAAALAGGNQ